MAKAATKEGTRKRPRRKPKEGPVYYVMGIEGWDWSYSFGLNKMKGEPDIYSDYRHLELTGTLLRPTAIKAQTVQLVFIPDDRYNQDNWHLHKTGHVGTLSLHRGRLTGLFSLPSNVLPSLLTMLAADRFKFVTIASTKLRYGNAVAQDFRLNMNIDDDDLPPDG